MKSWSHGLNMLKNFLDKLLNRQQDLVKEIIKSIQIDGDSWQFKILKERYQFWAGSRYTNVSGSSDYPHHFYQKNKDTIEYPDLELQEDSGVVKLSISKEAATLSHTTSDLCLKDNDFRDECGWYIAKPKNYILSKHESIILSKAVKSWKEGQYIKRLDPNYKLLSDSQKEVDLMFDTNS